MSRHEATITGNESVKICDVSRGTDMDAFETTVLVYGGGGNDFGGGTVTIQASPDNGTTKITLKDVSGTVVSITENDVYNIRLGYAGKLGEELQLYATMAGSTDSTVQVVACDNR